MSVIEKKMLLDEIVKTLSDVPLTMQNICNTISKCLDNYSVSREDKGTINTSFDYLSAFLQSKTIEGCSKGTLTRYEYIIKRLLKHVKVSEPEITVYHMRDYLSAQKARKISDATLRGERSIFSSYFGWLFKEKLIQNNPCDNLNAIKQPKKVRKPFSDIEIEKLKECCENARDRAIVSFLLATGCRISEVCSLDKSSVSFETKECTVLGKGNKERVVYINDVTAMLLARYFDERTDTNGALFAGRSGRIHPGGVRAMLKRLEKRSHVENVHPHRFRRTLATNLIKHGMPIQEVAKILGHEKIDTTMKYVYIENSSVKNSYNKYAA